MPRKIVEGCDCCQQGTGTGSSYPYNCAPGCRFNSRLYLSLFNGIWEPCLAFNVGNPPDLTVQLNLITTPPTEPIWEGYLDAQPPGWPSPIFGYGGDKLRIALLGCFRDPGTIGLNCPNKEESGTGTNSDISYIWWTFYLSPYIISAYVPAYWISFCDVCEEPLELSPSTHYRGQIPGGGAWPCAAPVPPPNVGRFPIRLGGNVASYSGYVVTE